MLFTLTHERIYFVAVEFELHVPYECGGRRYATVAILYRIAFSEAAKNGRKIREKKIHSIIK